MEFLKESWDEYLEFVKKIWKHHKTALVVVIVIFEILMLIGGVYLYKKSTSPNNETNTTQNIKVKNG